MDLLFKNETQYSQSIYKKYVEFHTKIYGFKYVFWTIVISSFLIFYLVIQIKANNFKYIFIAFFIILGFILWRILRPLFIVKKELSSKSIKGNETYTFSFYNKYFTIDSLDSIIKTNYFKLHKAFETKNFFYLYIDASHAFILNKSNFTFGTSKDFSMFLKKKLWFKYKLKI